MPYCTSKPAPLSGLYARVARQTKLYVKEAPVEAEWSRAMKQQRRRSGPERAAAAATAFEYQSWTGTHHERLR